MALSNLLPSRRRRGALTRKGDDWPEMSSLKQKIDRVFDDFFSGFDLSPFREMDERLGRFAPSIDVSETSKEIKVTAELPGMEEKDISISLEDDFLLIKGERKEEKKEEDEEYYHREMSYGSFRRVVPLDAKIDADKVKASFKKGILKVTLPKIPGAESEKSKKIEIKSAG
jgi:HSP20 family protein